MAAVLVVCTLVGLSAAADVLVCTLDSCYATEPALPRPTSIVGSDGTSSFLIPFIWTDLVDLLTTTTITTTITETDDSGALITPTVPVIVQPKGYWWRNQLLGPPVTPPGFLPPSSQTAQPVPSRTDGPQQSGSAFSSSTLIRPIISTSTSTDGVGAVVPVPITSLPSLTDNETPSPQSSETLSPPTSSQSIDASSSPSPQPGPGPDPNNPDPNNPDPNNPDPNNPDPNNPDPNNPDPNNPDPNSPDPNSPDPNNPVPNAPDPNNPDPSNPDPSNPDPSNPDPSNPDPNDPQDPDPDNPNPEDPDPQTPIPDPDPNPAPAPPPPPPPPPPYGPDPDICETAQTANDCTALCVASTVTSTSLTTSCSTTICGTYQACSATDATTSTIRTKDDDDACVIGARPIILTRPAEDVQAIIDLGDEIDKIIQSFNPKAPATADPSPTPTTLSTVLGPPPSTPADPPAPTPEPTQAPPPPPITRDWRIRLHQRMEHEWSEVTWSLIDSNGDERNSGQGSPITGAQLKADIRMEVRDPTDKDKTLIRFFYEFKGNLSPDCLEWAADGSTEGIGVCSYDAGCDMQGVEWKPWNAGFEREFECHFDSLENADNSLGA